MVLNLYFWYHSISINLNFCAVDVVNDIIEVYRADRKVSRKSILKILRASYKMLQKQPNTNHVRITDQQKLTVVGDIHGQLSDLLHIIDESGSFYNTFLVLYSLALAH